jgi:hypothetical protein
MDDLGSASRRKASLRQTAGAVFWSFFGVRKRADHEADIARLNPVHVIVMGILGAAIFIATLLIIVHFVVG